MMTRMQKELTSVMAFNDGVLPKDKEALFSKRTINSLVRGDYLKLLDDSFNGLVDGIEAGMYVFQAKWLDLIKLRDANIEPVAVAVAVESKDTTYTIHLLIT